ncbi:UNVERIFIED_CONTAM: hypothetical protein NCL1_00560 [Trichonephila clavipes]
MGRPGLCPARDRAQQIRGGRAEGAWRRLRRGTGRGARRPPRDLFRPWRAEIGARRSPSARDDLGRCHLPVGQQGAYRGRAAS